MMGSQPGRAYADGFSRPVSHYAKRGDCLACRSQPLRIRTWGDQHLRKIDDAHQRRRLMLSPLDEELASQNMMSIRAIEGANQDIGVENEFQRSSSSASSRSRYPGG